MNRAVSFCAAFAALIVGLGAIVHWASHHVSPAVIIYIALVPYSVAMSRLVPKPFWRTWYGQLARPTAMLAVGLAAHLAVKTSTSAFVFLAIGAMPMTYLAYRFDQQAHKICPDCAESVKAKAHICRYCRHEFTASVETPDQSGAGLRAVS